MNPAIKSKLHECLIGKYDYTSSEEAVQAHLANAKVQLN